MYIHNIFPLSYLPLVLCIGFIALSITTSTLFYILISIIIDFILPKYYTIKILAKIIKTLSSFLISHKLKQTIHHYNIEQYTSIYIIGILTLINICSIIISNHHSDYIYTCKGVINMSLITISIFTIISISDNDYLNYYIDNKLISIIYFFSIITNSTILVLIFNLLMSLKLISIYNSTYFIIKNNIKQNYLHLFLIYLNIINRYIDINQMLY